MVAYNGPDPTFEYQWQCPGSGNKMCFNIFLNICQRKSNTMSETNYIIPRPISSYFIYVIKIYMFMIYQSVKMYFIEFSTFCEEGGLLVKMAIANFL